MFPDSHDINDCCDELKTAFPKIKQDFEKRFPGWEMQLDYTHRTPEKQFELFKQGRSKNIKTGIWEVVSSNEIVTNRDGINKLSMHNYFPSRAFDVKLKNPDNDFIWTVNGRDTPEQWLYMPVLAKKYGLISGGTWKSIVDFPHIQIPE